jgi:hypothetical protein
MQRVSEPLQAVCHALRCGMPVGCALSRPPSASRPTGL